MKRSISKLYTPPSQPGFLGRGHIARPVIQIDFSESDPFIMLMDDILDKRDNTPVGGPHPHAGFETVSLMLEGEFGEAPHLMRAGDFEMMTAGSGVVHTEIIAQETKMRLLQLWLNLPKDQRHATPRVQKLSSAHVPAKAGEGYNVRVYSGTFAGITSPVKNHTPLILAEVHLQPGAKVTSVLPGDYATFIYAIEGTFDVGPEQTSVSKDQVAWLDQPGKGDSELELLAGEEGARLVIYAAEPQHHEIVSHGPFIADSMDDIRQLYSDFRAGKMEHITDAPAEQQLVY